MAVKTFTTGEVLTAADTNTYLANSGLVYVSGASFSNAASFDITGFTSTYRTHRVVLLVNRHTGSGASAMTATYRDSGTGLATAYYGGCFEVTYLGGTGVQGARNNGVNMFFGNVAAPTAVTQVTFDISGLNGTTVHATLTGNIYDSGATSSLFFGYENTSRTISIDRIRVACAVNMTGTWRVYGYREP